MPTPNCLIPMANLMPRLPGMTALSGSLRSYAPSPVWSDSTTKTVKFQHMPKKAATKLWHRARDFDRKTKRKDCHGGAVGHAALQVLHTLIFDFLNYDSGRLDPSYAAIARKANLCERAVANALKRLRELGILNWVRRCAEKWIDGRHALEQETNAYAVLPPSQWRGYKEPPEPPPPAPGTWGEHPPLPSQIELADIERRAGGGMRTMLQILGSDRGDPLAAALARLGRALHEGKVP
jgi:hypothetical protein